MVLSVILIPPSNPSQIQSSQGSQNVRAGTFSEGVVATKEPKVCNELKIPQGEKQIYERVNLKNENYTPLVSSVYLMLHYLKIIFNFYLFAIAALQMQSAVSPRLLHL